MNLHIVVVRWVDILCPPFVLSTMRKFWAKSVVLSALMASQFHLPVKAQQYVIEGEVVPRNVYDAAMVFNESVELIRNNLQERAIGKLKRALLLYPEMPQANTNMGILLARQGKNAEAKKFLLKAVAGKKATPEAFLALATLYQTTGNVDKSIDTYKEYLERFDQSGDREACEGAIALLTEEKERRAKAAAHLRDTKDYLVSGTTRGFLRWADTRMPLKVYLHPGDGVEGYKESYGNVLRQSFYDWMGATNKKIRFKFVSKKSDADIACFWTNDPKELGNGSEAGEARQRSVGQAIVSSEIYLRAQEETGGFPYTETFVQGTCLHEIGHALGINGHSPLPSDVMFFSTQLSDDLRQLTERDRRTINLIYGRQLDAGSQLLDFLLNPAMLGVSAIAVLMLTLIFMPVVVILKSKNKKKKRKKN